MDFLKNLGFDPIMLGAQILNFLIILFLLKRFLYKPMFSMIKKREDLIKEGVKQAEEAKQTLEKALLEEKKMLSKASEESKKIIEDARRSAQEVSREIEENTKNQTEKMIMEAKEYISQESKNAEEKILEKVSLLASEMLTKTLSGMIGEKEQKQIVDKALKQIKKVN